VLWEPRLGGFESRRWRDIVSRVLFLDLAYSEAGLISIKARFSQRIRCELISIKIELEALTSKRHR
jgi:hypothetical protein